MGAPGAYTRRRQLIRRPREEGGCNDTTQNRITVSSQKVVSHRQYTEILITTPGRATREPERIRGVVETRGRVGVKGEGVRTGSRQKHWRCHSFLEPPGALPPHA